MPVRSRTLRTAVIAAIFAAGVLCAGYMLYPRWKVRTLIDDGTERTFDMDRTAEALSAIGLRAVPALIDALDDPNVCVRYKAAVALGKLRAPSAVDALSRTLSDKIMVVRSASAISLGQIGDKKAIPALSERLRHRDLVVRIDVAGALYKLGSSEGLDVLRTAYNTPPSPDIGYVQDNERLEALKVCHILGITPPPTSAVP